MGRSFSVIYPEGGRSPPDHELVNSDQLPEKGKDGLMDRYVLGIGYSSASGLAYQLLDAKGHMIEDNETLQAAVATELASESNGIGLFARIIDANTTLVWPLEQCIAIERDMARLLKEKRAEMRAERMAELNGGDDAKAEVDEWDDDETVAFDAAIDNALSNALPYGETLQLIFREAVVRGGCVETN